MSEIDLIITQLEQAFHRRSWHGTNLLGSIRGLEPEAAARRPQPGRHNIWEIVVHTAYWKYSVWRRLVGETRGAFPLKGSNWFPRPDQATEATSEAMLKADIRMLKEYHAKLVEAVRQFDPKKLDERPPRSRFTYREMAIGAAAHDLYHAGQVQLMKRLQKG